MFESPGSALVVIPHPDDGEIGCGGTTAKWIRAGCKVFYLLCTNGDKGSNDRGITSLALAKVRSKEQLAAADSLGVEEVIMLGYPDGELEDTKQFRGEVVKAIRRFRPEVVICPDPFRTTPYWHRDHRICGQVTVDAVFPYARDYLHFSEHLRDDGLEPHKVGSLFLVGTESPDVYIDVSDSIDCKIQALYCHVSQVGPKDKDLDNTLGKRIRERAQETGSKAGYQYAEAFRHIKFGT